MTEFWPNRAKDCPGSRVNPHLVPDGSVRLTTEQFNAMPTHEGPPYEYWKELGPDGRWRLVERQDQYGHPVYFWHKLIITVKAAR